MGRLTLLLTVESGPKKGVTLECNVGEMIQIGRVIRGNALSLKDPSISQKHLVVQFLPEINCWSVADLGSVNGTYVNGILISPDNPSPLVDGDIISIGDKTRIAVHSSISEAETIPVTRQTRLKKITSEIKKITVHEANGGRMRRGRKMNSVNFEPVVMENNTRMLTRARSARVSEAKADEYSAIVISDSDSVEVIEKELPVIHGAEENKQASIGEKRTLAESIDDDMDRMTTAEWFDKMEDYLPKTISKFTEEIIAKLRIKARLFDEYAAQVLNA